MCGIAGLLLYPPGPVKAEWVQGLLHHLAHRGPDDRGWFSFFRGDVSVGQETPRDRIAELLLVHRRLSILDLSEAGRQPMVSPDGRYWIVFNGEIYNYLELRSELEALGKRFRSRSDTEVLLAAFVAWGTEALNRLVGMFAFAIFDRQTRRLVLGRDHFGIKPLYYAYWQDGFAFASEIPALLALPGVGRSVNAQRLYEYLRSGITDYGDQTLFAQVRQVPAAHYMEVSLDNPRSVQPIRYWQIDLDYTAALSFDEAAENLRDLFLESVRLHLRSDVAVGAALSGGIDSSAIVAAMRLLDPTLEIHTFSYVADEPAISEERWVDLLGGAVKATIHKVRPTPEELAADVDHLIRVQGEPFVSTSMYAQYRVFQRAQEVGIKVMLDGQGADELLGGYPIYRIAYIRSLLRQRQWGTALKLWRDSSTPPVGGFWWVTPQVLGGFIPRRFKNHLRQLVKKELAPAWLNTSWFQEHGVEPSSATDSDGRETLKHMLCRTLTETSLPQLLRYEDRNSMAFSIESRVPFLTHSLARFILALPEEYIVASNGTTKAVFREAMRGIVPDAILDRKDKKGFPTTQKQWLLSAAMQVERILYKSETAMQIPALNLSKVQSEWQKIVQGAEEFDSRVWRWVNFILWVEKFAVTVRQ